jgi:uncharacterized membrane protein
MQWLKENWLQVVILAVPLIVIAAAWDRFPDKVAVHWGGDGIPNRWENKAKGLLYVPLLNIAVAILLGWIPSLDPRLRRDPDASERSIAAIGVFRMATTLLMAAGSLVIATEALGYHFNILRAGMNLVLLFFIVMGNYFGSIRPNYFIGIRTPWTLESDEVWRATHRITGRILVFGSLLFLGLQFVVKLSYVMPCFLGFIVASMAWSVGYSYWLYRSVGASRQPPR